MGFKRNPNGQLPCVSFMFFSFFLFFCGGGGGVKRHPCICFSGGEVGPQVIHWVGGFNQSRSSTCGIPCVQVGALACLRHLFTGIFNYKPNGIICLSGFCPVCPQKARTSII